MIEYPAIVYSLNNIRVKNADNLKYTITDAYKITLITFDPDNEYVKKILEIPMCTFDTHFCSDNLNHYVFELYF